MNCGPKETYTLAFSKEPSDKGEGEVNFYKGKVTGNDDATFLELTECEARAFEGIYSECKEVRAKASQYISNILSKLGEEK